MIEFLEGLPVWLTAIMTVLTACTAITAITPSKSDDVILDKVLKVLNVLAGNVGKNENKDAE